MSKKSSTNSRKLKTLETQLRSVRYQKKSKLNELDSQRQQIAKLDNTMHAIQGEIDKITGNTIIVSEHATLSFFARVLGLDIEEIHKTILPDSVKAQIELLGGSGDFPVHSNDQTFKIRVKKNVVVTILK